MNHENESTQKGVILEGRYANYFKIGYNAVEFLLDFGQLYPEGEEVQLHTRIVTNPIYVKALFETLRESIDRYEQDFVVIPKEVRSQQGKLQK